MARSIAGWRQVRWHIAGVLCAAAALLGLSAGLAHGATINKLIVDKTNNLFFSDVSDLHVDAKKDFVRITGERVVQTNTGTFKSNSVIIDIPLEPLQGLVVQVLDPPGIPEASGHANSISRDESCVVGHRDNGFFTPDHAFRWTQAGGSVDLGTLDPAHNSSRSSSATGVSSDCSVVVGSSDVGGTTQHAFRWTATAGMVDLGAPAGASRSSRAFAVSADGTVIVGDSEFADSNTISGIRNGAFRWTAGGAGTFQSLGALEPGFPSVATAVSADGAVVVGTAGISITVGNTSTNGSRAFRWTQSEGMQPIGPLPSHRHTAATGVSDNGKIVVGTSSSSPFTLGRLGDIGSGAFRWTEATGIKDLRQSLVDGGVDMTGITLVAVTGISPDGQWIAGAATTSQTGPNETVGFIAQYCDDAIGGPCSTGGSASAAFSIAASSPAGLTVAAGQSVSTTLTLTPSSGFTQPISFSCSGLPSGASCSFSPATVTPAGAPLTTTLTITSDGSAVAMSLRAAPASTLAYALAPMAILSRSLIVRRRRSHDARRWACAGLLATAMLVLLTACGGGGDGGAATMGPTPSGSTPPALTGTPAGTSNVTVTATSGSGPAAVSSTITIPLTVTP